MFFQFQFYCFVVLSLFLLRQLSTCENNKAPIMKCRESIIKIRYHLYGIRWQQMSRQLEVDVWRGLIIMWYPLFATFQEKPTFTILCLRPRYRNPSKYLFFCPLSRIFLSFSYKISPVCTFSNINDPLWLGRTLDHLWHICFLLQLRLYLKSTL